MSSYPYRVYPIGRKGQFPDLSEFKEKEGNYVFAKCLNGGWEAIHCGETMDLSKQPDEFSTLFGITHVHVRENPCGSAVRKGEVEDLKKKNLG